MHPGVDMFYLFFSGLKGFNQFKNSPLLSAMENSQTFCLLACPPPFFLLSSFGTIRNLQMILDVLILPHGASFPHVVGNFSELIFSRGFVSVGISCATVVKKKKNPSKPFHGSCCWSPRPILSSQLVDPMPYRQYAPGTSHLLLFHSQVFTFSWALPSTAPGAQRAFLLLPRLVSSVFLLPFSYRWQRVRAPGHLQGTQFQLCAFHGQEAKSPVPAWVLKPYDHHRGTLQHCYLLTILTDLPSFLSYCLSFLLL